MTLIINVATADKVIQVSDRRLTWTNGKIDDDSNKVICATCADAYFTIGYAGLAVVGGKTDKWLFDFLLGIKINELQLFSIVEKLKAEITRRLTLSSIDKINKGITFVFCGFKENTPFILHISNIENEKSEPLAKVDDVFHVGEMHKRRDSIPEDTLMIDYHGMEPAMTPPILTLIDNLANEKYFHQNSDETISQKLVDIVREASQTPRYGKYIGRNCMAVVVYPPGNEQSFRTIYYPDQSSPKVFMPHLILGGQRLKM